MIQRFGYMTNNPYLCINKKKQSMDYIILTKNESNGTHTIKTFSDGTIPFYHNRDEAIADMGENDKLFRVEEEYL